MHVGPPLYTDSTVQVKDLNPFVGGRAKSGVLCDRQRQQSYMAAVRLNAEITTMGRTVSGLVRSLNIAVDSGSGEVQGQPNAVAQILRILNTHYEHLRWVDGNCQKLSATMAQIENSPHLLR